MIETAKPTRLDGRGGMLFNDGKTDLLKISSSSDECHNGVFPLFIFFVDLDFKCFLR